MTDKLKALMAKWRGIGALRSKDCFCGNCMSAKSFGVCADELEEALAEQAPAGEWDALLYRAKNWKESDLRRFPTATLELIDALVLAAGRSSQPTEPRDPAGK